jgi:hypothetical protein
MTDVKEHEKSNGPVVPRAANGRWLPGAVPNPAGRGPGVRARYAEKFLADAYASWKQHGAAALEQLRQEDLKAYCQLMAGLLPKNLVIDADARGPLDDLSPEQLAEMLEAVRAFKAKQIDVP